jgi:hypothetical protein
MAVALAVLAEDRMAVVTPTMAEEAEQVDTQATAVEAALASSFTTLMASLNRVSLVRVAVAVAVVAATTMTNTGMRAVVLECMDKVLMVRQERLAQVMALM